MRSGNSETASSPGHTTTAPAATIPREVSSLGGSTDSTAVWRKNTTPWRSASHAAILGTASQDSTRRSIELCSTASTFAPTSAGQRADACARLKIRHPSPISVRTNASSTATASARRVVIHSPRCRIEMPAWRATSSQIAALRRARAQDVPRSCPVTVMKPKFRTDAPFARASRSITTVRSPRSAAARAQDSPMIPAPTTARSKTPETAD